jgi:hypothetical protein
LSFRQGWRGPEYLASCLGPLQPGLGPLDQQVPLKLLDLKLDDVALANIAWCSTMTNKYPPDMLNRCFATHTRALLADLNPDVVILTGAATRPFVKPIAEALPGALVVPTWHCSNREKRVDEAAELARIKALMDGHQPYRPSRFVGTAGSVKPIGRWIREGVITELA